MIRSPASAAGRGIGCARATGELRIGPRAAGGRPARWARRRRLGHARRRAPSRCESCSRPAASASSSDADGAGDAARRGRAAAAGPRSAEADRHRAQLRRARGGGRRRAAREPDLLRQVRATRCGPTAPPWSCRRRARRSTTRPRSRSSSGGEPRTWPRPTRSTTSPATRCSTTSRRATCSSRPRSGCRARSSTAPRPAGRRSSPPTRPGRHDAIGIALDLNGERMQEDTTAGLIFSIPELVAHLSRLMTLEPGDVVATGTPPASAARATRACGCSPATRSWSARRSSASCDADRVSPRGAAGSGARSRRGRGRDPLRRREAGDERERQEPDDVEVEPVARR